MLSVSKRYVSRSNTKIRGFVFAHLVFNSNPFSTSSSACFLTTLTQPHAETGQSHSFSLSATDIVRSFKDWFKFGGEQTRLLDDIFKILRSPRIEKDAKAMDLALSDLGFRLSEQLVLRVLAHGKNDVLSCLKFFDWAARQPGFYHTRNTLHAIFKILRRAKLMSLMLDFLGGNLKDDSYAHALRLCDTLVMGYAVAGRPEIALHLFGKMRFRGLDLDYFGYHVLLNALVEESCFDSVDVIAKQISDRGFECGVTHNILVKGLCKQNRLAEAEQHFRGLLSKDVAAGRYEYALSSLVDTLCKNNMSDQAHRLLEDCRELGVQGMDNAYSVWIKSLVRVGNLNGALRFLQMKKSLEGYVPEVFRYNVLMYKLVRANRFKEVCDILVEMKECGILPDKGTVNAVLCFFCKAGMVDVALELYRSGSELGITPNVIAYNYLINTLCGNGNVDEAYLVLMTSVDQGQFPGRKTLSILAEALCREGKLQRMKELVLLALEHNFVPSDSICDKLISALCKARRVEEAYLIHGELSNKNIGTARNIYVSLIYGFIKSNRGDISARLLIEMQEKGFTLTRKLCRAIVRSLCDMKNPTSHFFNLLEMQLLRLGRNCEVYNFFIEGAGHAREPDLAREVFETMVKDGIHPNLKSEIFMLQSYLKSDKIADALNFFDGFRQRRNISRKLYNSMIIGLCKINKLDIALHFLQEAREKGLLPSIECYEHVIQNLCRKEQYETAVCIVNDYKKSGRSITSFIGNVLLYNALKNEAVYEAWIRKRDVEDETSEMSLLGELIGVFSGRFSLTVPFEKLEEVIGKCFPLDIYTYNLLLRRLSMRHVDDAFEMFDRLFHKGYEPNRWTLGILKHCVLKAGRTDEANKWLNPMHGREMVPFIG